MSKTIISDTSCLILFHKIGYLQLLEQLFGKVTITSNIAKEFGQPLPEFIVIEDPENLHYQKILETHLDSGEASAMALAIEKSDSLLIIDESKARKQAKALKLNYTGTIGILIASKDKGLIKSVTSLLEQIVKTNFRISNQLLKSAKRKSNE